MTAKKDYDRCGSPTKKGGLCKNAQMLNGRCRMHGGKHVTGMANASYKHGRYSKAMPARLLERYHAMQEGSILPSLEDEIALTYTRVDELIGRITTGEASSAWETLTAAYDAMFAEPEQREQHMATILRVLSTRRHDYAVWSDIHRTVEQARKLVDSQNRLLAAREASYSVEQMLTMLAAVVDSVRRHVDDKRAIQNVAKDMEAFALQDTG